MKYIEDNHPIWAVIKNAYTHNDQPIIFAIFNILIIIAVGMTIYGIIKWKKDGTHYRFLTILSGTISIFLIGYIVFFLFIDNNEVGKYKGTANVSFTSSVNGTSDKVARLSDKNSESNSFNTVVMDGEEMDKMGIKAGRTITVETANKPKPSEDRAYVRLEKSDIKDVSDNKQMSQFNKQQQDKEDKAQKEKEEKEKKDKEKKDKEKKDKKK